MGHFPPQTDTLGVNSCVASLNSTVAILLAGLYTEGEARPSVGHHGLLSKAKTPAWQAHVEPPASSVAGAKLDVNLYSSGQVQRLLQRCLPTGNPDSRQLQLTLPPAAGASEASITIYGWVRQGVIEAVREHVRISTPASWDEGYTTAMLTEVLPEWGVEHLTREPFAGDIGRSGLFAATLLLKQEAGQKLRLQRLPHELVVTHPEGKVSTIRFHRAPLVVRAAASAAPLVVGAAASAAPLVVGAAASTAAPKSCPPQLTVAATAAAGPTAAEQQILPSQAELESAMDVDKRPMDSLGSPPASLPPPSPSPTPIGSSAAEGAAPATGAPAAKPSTPAAGVPTVNASTRSGGTSTAKPPAPEPVAPTAKTPAAGASAANALAQVPLVSATKAPTPATGAPAIKASTPVAAKVRAPAVGTPTGGAWAAVKPGVLPEGGPQFKASGAPPVSLRPAELTALPGGLLPDVPAARVFAASAGTVEAPAKRAAMIRQAKSGPKAKAASVVEGPANEAWSDQQAGCRASSQLAKTKDGAAAKANIAAGKATPITLREARQHRQAEAKAASNAAAARRVEAAAAAAAATASQPSTPVKASGDSLMEGGGKAAGDGQGWMNVGGKSRRIEIHSGNPKGQKQRHSFLSARYDSLAGDTGCAYDTEDTSMAAMHNKASSVGAAAAVDGDTPHGNNTQ